MLMKRFTYKCGVNVRYKIGLEINEEKTEFMIVQRIILAEGQNSQEIHPNKFKRAQQFNV